MGLPLYNNPSSLYLSDLEPDLPPDEPLILRKRLGGPTLSRKHPRSRNQRSRPVVSQVSGDYHPRFLRHSSAQSRDRSACRNTEARGHRRERPRQGRDLTRSYSPAEYALPRTPSLEREEAFCGDRPGKKRARLHAPGDGPAGNSGDEAEDETTRELYRLGLLYDDEYERGEAFGFGAILRDEEVYKVSVRKLRGKTGRGGEVKRRCWMADSWALSPELALELSFAMLGEDETLAAWMMESERDCLGEMEVARCKSATHGPGLDSAREDTEMASCVVDAKQTDACLRTERRREETPGPTRALPRVQRHPERISGSQVEEALDGAEWEILDGDSGSTEGTEIWVVLD